MKTLGFSGYEWELEEFLEKIDHGGKNHRACQAERAISAFGQVDECRNRERLWLFHAGGNMVDRDRRLMSPASGLSDAEALDFLSWLPPN